MKTGASGRGEDNEQDAAVSVNEGRTRGKGRHHRERQCESLVININRLSARLTDDSNISHDEVRDGGVV
ncbi:hypothetical protein Pcinc_027505 [Petrolisthes cinctipes]|uniref:Uncharacterized protein n=1 Tax=Petrolisthes cinctipes TaxID=88211 RepID=A0AAE1F491_PETCI|nr:hypothetical protein Pcinc_027505 [Petrolisthes cinctipes]